MHIVVCVCAPYFLLHICSLVSIICWYGDGAGNTVEENSSVFSLIRMH